MRVLFSAVLTLPGVPTVRHILDIEESMRGMLAALCHQPEDALSIASGRVAGDAMTVRFAAMLTLQGIASEEHAREVEAAIQQDLRQLRCLAADDLTIDSCRIDISRRGAGSAGAGASAIEQAA